MHSLTKIRSLLPTSRLRTDSFVVETDCLTPWGWLPNRSLYLLQGKVGAGKSLIAQRLIHGMVHNGVKVLVITTELTTEAGLNKWKALDTA